MILEEIHLKDWKSYGGQHSFYIAPGPQGNKTVIVHGKNAYGKTSLMEALRFVLYGFREHKGRRNMLWRSIHDRKRDRGMVDAEVRTVFTDKGDRYELIRRIKSSRRGVASKDHVKDDVTLRNISKRKEIKKSDVRSWVENRLLPEDLHQFFFFDAERIDDVANPSNPTQIRQAVRTVLGITFLEDALDTIEKALGELERERTRLHQKQVQDEQLRHELEELSEKEARHQKTLEGLLENIESTKVRKERLENQIEEARRELVDTKALREVDEELSRTGREMENLHTSAKRVMKDLPYLMLKDRLEEAVDGFQDARMRFEDKLIAYGEGRGRADLLRRLLEGDLSKVVSGSGKGLLVGELENAEARSTKRPATPSRADESVINAADAVLHRIMENPFDLAEYIEKREELHERKRTAEKHKIELESKAVGDVDGMRHIEDSRDRVVAELSRYEADKRTVRRDLDEVHGEIATLQLEIRKAAPSLDTSAIDKKISALAAAREVFGARISTYETEKKKLVEDWASKRFLQLTGMPERYNGIRIGDDWRLTIIDKDKKPISSPSHATEQIKAIAFLCGLSAITRKEFPVFIDAPLGALDELHREKLLTNLEWLGSQVMLAVTDAELPDDLVKKFFSVNLAAHYQLDYDQKTGLSSAKRLDKPLGA